MWASHVPPLFWVVFVSTSFFSLCGAMAIAYIFFELRSHRKEKRISLEEDTENTLDLLKKNQSLKAARIATTDNT